MHWNCLKSEELFQTLWTLSLDSRNDIEQMWQTCH